MTSLSRYARAQAMLDDLELSIIDLYQQRESAILEYSEVKSYEGLLTLIDTIYKLDKQIDRHIAFIRKLKEEIGE